MVEEGGSKNDFEKTINDLERSIQDLEEKNNELGGSVRIISFSFKPQRFIQCVVQTLYINETRIYVCHNTSCVEIEKNKAFGIEKLPNKHLNVFSIHPL